MSSTQSNNASLRPRRKAASAAPEPPVWDVKRRKRCDCLKKKAIQQNSRQQKTPEQQIFDNQSLQQKCYNAKHHNCAEMCFWYCIKLERILHDGNRLRYITFGPDSATLSDADHGNNISKLNGYDVAARKVWTAFKEAYEYERNEFRDHHPDCHDFPTWWYWRNANEVLRGYGEANDNGEV